MTSHVKQTDIGKNENHTGCRLSMNTREIFECHETQLQQEQIIPKTMPVARNEEGNKTIQNGP